MTPERLAELRRIAEAATPGPWWVDGWEVRTKDGDRFIASIAPAFQGASPDASCWEVDANIQYIAAFASTTALALLDEIERLRKEREVLAEAVMGWQRYLERDVGTERVHVKTLEAHGRALALLEGGGGE